MTRKFIVFLLIIGAVFSYSSFINTGFKYYIPFKIYNPNTQNLNDFQVKLNVNTSYLISKGYMKSDCSDIRFVDPENGYELPYWIESGCNTNTTVVWVKVDSLPANSNKTFWLVFGNPYTNSESDGDKVFEFFDDFEQGNLNGWRFTGTKGWQISNIHYDGKYGAQNQDIGDSQSAYMYRSVNLPAKSIISFYWKVSSEHNYDYLRFYIDGSQKNAISGDVNWQKKEYVINSGNHEIKFGYTKDGSVSRGTDTGYVDLIIIREYANKEPQGTISYSKLHFFNVLDKENFSYYLPIEIDNPNNENLSGYQVHFVLNTKKLISLGLMNPDCSDLRVTNLGNINLPYWIETGTCNTTNTRIWFKAPLLKPGENIFYIYFGNPNAKSESNGEKVFEFFDDFNGSSLNTDLWNITTKVSDPNYATANITLDNDSSLNGFASATAKHWQTQDEECWCPPYESPECCYPVTIDHWQDNDAEIILRTKKKLTGKLRIKINASGNVSIITNKKIINTTNNYTEGVLNDENVSIKCIAQSHHNSVTSSFSVDYIFVRKYVDKDPTFKINLSNIKPTSPMFYYVKVKVINDQPKNFTDVQIPIYLNESNFDFDLADFTGLTIRIYDKRVSNPYVDIKNNWNYKGIPYWIEYFKPKEKRGLIWVKLNLSPNQNKTLYIYFSRYEPIRFDIYNPGNTTLTNYQIRLPNNIYLDPDRKYKIYLEGDENQLLPWWSKDNRTWIKVSRIHPGNNYLIIKEDPIGLSSNGSKVFEFFDDFLGDHIDTTKWQSTNDAALNNGILTISTNYNDIISKEQFSPNTVIGFKTKLRENQYNTVLFAVNSLNGYGPGFLLKQGKFYKIKDKYIDSSDWSSSPDTINTEPGWRIFELYWLPSNSYLMFDNYRVYINNFNAYQNRNGYIGLGAWDSGAEFDYVYVRKYANPEPIVYVATNADDGYKVFDFFDDFDSPWFNWVRGSGSYGPIQYMKKDGFLVTWSNSGWQTMYSPRQWKADDKIVVEIKDRSEYNYNWHKAYITDKDDGSIFKFGVFDNNGSDTVELYPEDSWKKKKENRSYTTQNFKWYIHQIIKDGNHYTMNWLDANNRSLLNSYSADTTTYRNDLVIRQWQYVGYPRAEWDWVKVYKYLDNPPKVVLDKTASFKIVANTTLLPNTTIRIYYPSGTNNIIFNGTTDSESILHVPIVLNAGYYDFEAVIGNTTIRRNHYYIDPRGIKNPIFQSIEESVINS